MNELKTFNPELMDKDYIVALTKCDLLDNELSKEYSKELNEYFKNINYCMISAVEQSGLVELKDLIWKSLNKPHE